MKIRKEEKHNEHHKYIYILYNAIREAAEKSNFLNGSVIKVTVCW